MKREAVDQQVESFCFLGEIEIVTDIVLHLQGFQQTMDKLAGFSIEDIIEWLHGIVVIGNGGKSEPNGHLCFTFFV